MDNKTYNSDHEEEYQLQEPESRAGLSGSNTPVSANFFERISRQHIVTGLVLIFFVYGAYKLVNRLFHAVLTKPQTLEKNYKLAAAPPLTHANSSGPVNADTTTNRLAYLAQRQLEVQSAIHSLDSQMSGVQASLASVNSQLVQVNDELQSLNSGQALLIQKQTKSTKKIDEKKKETPKPIYYVRAMIPGRVWFTAQDGSTLTLGLGDNLVGYGTIDSINIDQGVVILSSGAIIGYNPSDR